MRNGCEFKSRALRNGFRRQTGNIHGDYLPGATSACPIWQINECLKLQTDIPGIRAHRGCVGLCLNFPLRYFVSQSSFIAVTWSFGQFPDGEPSTALKTSACHSAPLAGRVQKRAHTQQQQGSTCINIHIRTCWMIDHYQPRWVTISLEWKCFPFPSHAADFGHECTTKLVKCGFPASDLRLIFLEHI